MTDILPAADGSPVCRFGRWSDLIPTPAYNEFMAIKAALPQLERARSLRAACNQVAGQIGTLTGSALYRRIREYRASKDERALVDRRTCAALWKGERVKLPASFKEFFLALREKHARVATSAYKELLIIWRTHCDADGRTVDKIPGYSHWPEANPVTGVPAGWSYENLRRAIPEDPYDTAAAKQGLFAASEFRPPVLTTRVGLRLGERVEFDDHEFDVKVHFPGQTRAMRPICFGAVDGLSSFAEVATRPVFWDEVSETKKKLTEFQFRCFVVHWLTTHGYRADSLGTTFFCEAGTAVIREAFAESLARATGGRVSVRTGRIFAESAHPGQYSPRGKGNFRFKPAIEGFWGILENALDRLPGRTGSNARLNGPAELHGREMVLARILKLLPTLAPERAQEMKLPFLTFRQFTHLAFEAMRSILEDPDHALEGWEELGYVKKLWRPDVSVLKWSEQEEFERLPEHERQVLAPCLADPALALTRTHRLSRWEVFQQQRHELTRCHMEQYCRLFPLDDGFEVTVSKQRLIEFTDRARFGAEEFRFLANSRFGDFMPGDKFLAFFNPLNPRWLQLCKADGTHLAMVEAWETRPRNDLEGIHKQIGKQAGWEGTKKQRLAARHFDEAEQRLHIAEHNAAVLKGGPVTAEEKARAKEISDNVRELGEPALEAMLDSQPVAEAPPAAEPVNTSDEEFLGSIL